MKYAPVGHVVVRNPLLPLTTLARSQASRASGRARLDAVLRDPLVLEAIALAAPSLVASLEVWRAHPESERGQHLERALVSYVTRLASRCTPFGLFATVSLGRVGKKTRLVLPPDARLTRRTRLDMGYLQAVCDAVSARPEVLDQTLLYSNETVHQVGERLHFVSAHLNEQQRVYELQSVDALEVLVDLVLPQARDGQTRAELARRIAAAMPEVDEASALSFVDELVHEQVLRSELQPLLTGREALSALLEQLERVNATTELEVLRRVSGALSALDDAPFNDPSRYQALGDLLEPLGVPVEAGKVVQVDAARLVEGLEVGEGLAQALLTVAQLVTAAVPQPPGALTDFRSAFSARYEGREVPLLEALDEEAGVGFLDERVGHRAPLLDGLEFPTANTRELTVDDEWAEWTLGLQQRARLNPAHEVVLTEAELAKRARRPPRLPDSFLITCSLLAPASTHEPLAVYESISGPSSENLLGRFTWLDASIEAAATRALRGEEALRPEACFVELVHAPQGRAGNVIARPALREVELPILARSGTPRASQLALADLTLQLQGGRLVLRSKTLGREVLPRLSNAHNHSTFGLPVYRFLAALQHEGLSPRTSFVWGGTDAPFLPRVRVGRIVVARARWVLTKQTLEQLDDATRLRATAKALGMPRYLLAREFDHTLSVDLEDDLSVDCFLGTYGHEARVVLEEDLLRVYGSAVTMNGEPMANEVHVPFVASERAVAAARASVAEHGAHQASHAPGSEWLYVRVHAAPATADRLLVERLAPVIAQAKRRGEVDRWFFLRYDEQGHHLRLRMHGEPRRLLDTVYPALSAALAPELDAGTVSKLVLDTYRPETERYGGSAGLRLAEAWFEVDSASVLDLLQRYPDEAGLEARGWCGLVGVLDTLELLLPADASRLAALEQWRDALFHEFAERGASALESSLSKRARERRARVETLATTRVDAEFEEGLAVLRARRSALEPIAQQYRDLAETPFFTTSLVDLAGAMMHMHLNRLLRVQQRKQELVLYDALARTLSSKLARAMARVQLE